MPFLRGLLTVAMLLALAAPAVAADPVLLGSFRDWSAYSATGPGGKTCYALSKPTATLPRNAKRGPIYVLVSTWPDRGVADEVQIVSGYPYRDGEPVWAEVGAHRTEFFSRNDRGDGSAWVKDLNDEAALISAMRSGSALIVTGLSSRGTKTTDTYSLAGISAALDRAHRACGR